MKVILVSDVKNVGKKGDVVDVSEGYAVVRTHCNHREATVAEAVYGVCLF